jgi:SAM-dependent methyltransferase
MPVLAPGESEAAALDRLRRQYAIGRKAFLPPAPAGGRLLEIGCGNGGYLFLMRRLGWEVVGVESAPSVARAAREGLGLDIRAGTLQTSSFPDAHFHRVALHHSFEHLHSPSAALREIRRVLRPGGVVAIACPNARSLVHRLTGRFCMSWDPPRHLQMFTAPALRQLVEACGFRILRVTTPTRMAAYILLNSLRFRQLAPRRGVGFWSVLPGDPQVPFAWRWGARLIAVAEAFSAFLKIPLGEELCLVAQRLPAQPGNARETT